MKPVRQGRKGPDSEKRVPRRAGALIAVLAFAALGLLGFADAPAQNRRPLEEKVRRGSEVVIPAGQTIPHDLYVSGGRVSIDGGIRGDLVVVGGEVDVTGPVNGDVVVAGGRVTMTGPVSGDVRAAGGQVQIGGRIGEDVLATAGQLTLTSSSRVQEDLVFAAGDTRLAGRIAGSVLGGTGNYEKTGSVGGTEKVTIGERRAERRPSVLDRIVGGVRRYLGIVAVGALMLWLGPRVMQAAARALQETPLRVVGFGVLGVIGYVVSLVVLFLVTLLLAIALGILGFGALAATTVFGGLLSAGLLTFAFVVVVLFVAAAVVGIFVGHLLLPETAERGRFLLALLIGALIVVVLTGIPIVGGVLNFVTVVLGLGGLLALVRRPRRPAPVQAA